ncbi:DUF2254 domain-containing protein [Streptomyces sp. NBC_00237]|uniref:DUF2254 domain-containing protein n=1 Tax=Streptomyces sp. NBC_00237 TaxID=2975687 RepID=UPI002253F92C|nr:DUF2254 domain-containing protein [Streptomyces sp. NBC_00237]MCX5202996.1 DUF2254 domain-containing protein [Streptomyces sp. NBC_00237]
MSTQEPSTGSRNQPRYRRPRALSPLREHLRDTFWFAPTAGLVLVLLLWWAASGVDQAVVGLMRADGDYAGIAELIGYADDAKTIITTVSSAMMTFIGVVFSISLVAVQMASGQFSPRVVRIFVRSRITKLTFSVFLATFVLSLLVLAAYDGETDPERVGTVPLVQSVVTMLMVALSLALFIAYVNSTLRLMRVSHVIDRISRASLALLKKQEREWDEDVVLGAETARFTHQGRAGVLRDVHIARLVRVARRRGAVLRLIPRIGDFVVPGTPVIAVHGGEGVTKKAVRHSVSVGVERTFHQDLGFGLRQLADIALRALSPAVNDPTTAVQALDRIVQFLAVAVELPLGALRHRDGEGRVRFVQAVPGWADLVDLGLTEIRGVVAGNPQVSRRMVAGLDDLLLLAPEERRGVLERHRALLVEVVERTVPDAADREFALTADRQGIG